MQRWLHRQTLANLNFNIYFYTAAAMGDGILIPHLHIALSVTLSPKQFSDLYLMSQLDDIEIQKELHSFNGIKECFLHGVIPNYLCKVRTLMEVLTSEYARSPRFKDCVKTFVDFGLQFHDPVLLSVLLNNAENLYLQLKNDKEAVAKKYSLRSTYTQCSPLR